MLLLQLVFTMVFYGIELLQVETLHVHCAIAKKYTCDFFIPIKPATSSQQVFGCSHPSVVKSEHFCHKMLACDTYRYCLN